MGYIFLGVVVCFIVFMIIKNKPKSMIKIKGKIINKTSTVYSEMTPTRFGPKPTSYTEYVFTFELENHTQVELLVDKDIYNKYFENDFGLVSYKGNKLVSFEK